jgi:hypothetical protein
MTESNKDETQNLEAQLRQELKDYQDAIDNVMFLHVPEYGFSSALPSRKRTPQFIAETLSFAQGQRQAAEDKLKTEFPWVLRDKHREYLAKVSKEYEIGESRILEQALAVYQLVSSGHSKLVEVNPQPMYERYRDSGHCDQPIVEKSVPCQECGTELTNFTYAGWGCDKCNCPAMSLPWSVALVRKVLQYHRRISAGLEKEK